MAFTYLYNTRNAAVRVVVVKNLLDDLVTIRFIKATERRNFDIDRLDDHPVKVEKYNLGWNSPYSAASVLSLAAAQRAAALSSSARALTHWPPSGVSSNFQNGALVFSQSIKK